MAKEWGKNLGRHCHKKMHVNKQLVNVLPVAAPPAIERWFVVSVGCWPTGSNMFVPLLTKTALFSF